MILQKSRIGSRTALSRWGGEGLLPYISLMITMWHLRGMVFEPFWSATGCRFEPFWSGV